MRALVLAPEIALASATAVSFAALLGAGPRSGRLSRFALLLGCAVALVAAVLTRNAGDEFLFRVYRIDPLSQLAKVAVLLGALVAATTAQGEDRWAAMRVTSPFFHLCVTLALVATMSIVDLIAAPLAWWCAAVSAVLLAASVGRWSVLEKVVRRSLAGFLGVSALTFTGALIAAAAGASTRLDTLRAAQDIPAPGALSLGLLLWSAVAVWLLAVAPFQLQRLADDPSGSRAAPVLASTALVAAGGLALLRAVSLAMGGLPDAVIAVAIALLIAPAFVAAARRFAISFEKRVPAFATSIVALIAAAWLVWPWIRVAVGDLD